MRQFELFRTAYWAVCVASGVGLGIVRGLHGLRRDKKFTQRREGAKEKENTREKEHHLSFRSSSRSRCDGGAGEREPGRIGTEYELVNDNDQNEQAETE